MNAHGSGQLHLLSFKSSQIHYRIVIFPILERADQMQCVFLEEKGQQDGKATRKVIKVDWNIQTCGAKISQLPKISS